MKILHVWNTAGVAGTLAKITDRFSKCESFVIHRRDCDHFNYTVKGVAYREGPSRFALRALVKSLRYDIIHVHSLDRIIPYFRILHRKPIILHYHGTEIRGHWETRRRYWSKADRILVSTPDLLKGSPPGTVYLPNTVDPDLFKPTLPKKEGVAFHVSRYADDLALEYAQRYGLRLVVHDRDETPVHHDKFAQVLSSYEYYIDVKRDCTRHLKVLPAFSLTGLEALACGCKVIDWKGDLVEGLPEDHRPENVVSRLAMIYEDVGNGNSLST